MISDGYYYVPFSSHSNFNEMEKLVASIQPAVLKPVVPVKLGGLDYVGNIKHFHQYKYNLQNLKQRGLEFLKEQYTNRSRASNAYKKYAFSSENQRKLMKRLGVRPISEARLAQMKGKRAAKSDIGGRRRRNQREDGIFQNKNLDSKMTVYDHQYKKVISFEAREEENTNLRLDDMFSLASLRNREEKVLKERREGDKGNGLNFGSFVGGKGREGKVAKKKGVNTDKGSSSSGNCLFQGTGLFYVSDDGEAEDGEFIEKKRLKRVKGNPSGMNKFQGIN